MTDLAAYARDVATRARNASRELVCATGAQKIDWLKRSAQAVRDQASALIHENAKDLEKAPEYGLTSAGIDRLRLTEDRLEGIALALEQVASLPDPVGEVIEGSVRPNGLRIERVRVPLGVVFFIYESRPNVTADAAALCVKSGNAVILRGGKEALHSNLAFHRLLSETLESSGLPGDAVQLVSTTDREAVGHFLGLGDLIDVTIPRGGKSLIARVAAEATMPVIKHFDGICHVYVDKSANLNMAGEIVVNSKTQRPGVCNAAETLLVHAEVADLFLPQAAAMLGEQGVALKGCEKTCAVVASATPASEDDFRTEWLDLVLSVKVVENADAAIEHINEYGSQHTDAIVTEDLKAARQFTSRVDSAAVMVNASTRFNDGGEFGLGAEIGISTDKFHARGPCGLRELTTYKYVVQGEGQIKS
jgi:glutamate-5-semialdehyde dehydrogenase